jgi:FXSXX-COOH protein
VKISPAVAETLGSALSIIERAPLTGIASAQAARVRRRIVDNESHAPRLDVAAFNSATT